MFFGATDGDGVYTDLQFITNRAKMNFLKVPIIKLQKVEMGWQSK